MATLVYLAAAFALVVGARPNDKKHHVLMIASDDMRPEMSPYGFEYMKTPNFQKLADDGFTFRNAYVQQALCAPSRTVLLTSRRPDTSRVWTIGPYFRDTTLRNVTTLPEFFRKNGYRSIGHGKIFHEGNASGFPLDQDQEYGSWSVPYFHPFDTYNKFNKTNPNPKPGTVKAPLSHGAVDEPWQTFNDAASALRAVEWIKNASQYEEPFFLAVGFHRPHIPYIYPKEFEFEGDVKFPPDDYHITKDIPACAPHDWTGEGTRYADLWSIKPSITDHNFQSNLSSLCTAVPFEYQRGMKHAYYSCIQYIDHLVGQLIGALQEEGLYEQTTIIFWGDHGYKLGEHCDWFKHDNYEDSTRIPVLLKPSSLIPDLPKKGVEIASLVEEVDIFPTLINMAGFEPYKDLEGTSWLPLLREPTQLNFKPRVFSQYPHYSQAHKEPVMGYSMRTPDYRYTEWVSFPCNTMKPMNNCPLPVNVTPRWDSLVGRELYNHTADRGVVSFGAYENDNYLAVQPEYADLVKQLSDELHANWHKPEQ